MLDCNYASFSGAENVLFLFFARKFILYFVRLKITEREQSGSETAMRKIWLRLHLIRSSPNLHFFSVGSSA